MSNCKSSQVSLGLQAHQGCQALPGPQVGLPGPQGKPGGVYVGPTVPNISDDEMLPLWVDISELEGVVTEGLPRRSDTTFEITLGALASGDHDAVIAPGYRLLRIATDQPARVRVSLPRQPVLLMPRATSAWILLLLTDCSLRW